MALIDKVKAQAAQLAQKAQEAGKAGQAKLEDVQARRHADALLRELGAVVYATRTGRGDADSATKVEALIGELNDYESEHGVLDESGSPDDSEVQPHDGGQDPGADFKLEP